ncbi:hypothetical protein MNBD_GAMMA12-3658 [hydrothermal vent metagenome]|uniref:Peptidase S49 domain-containing protein n=1 Tax=hydrothermal vent metagenome TaxID=652676 RepID=A0A3B0XS21_9ZZZZ
MSSFDFSKLADKYGVKRHLITVGSLKSRIDPFLKLKDNDRLKFKTILKNMHNHFIHIVKLSCDGNWVV